MEAPLLDAARAVVQTYDSDSMQDAEWQLALERDVMVLRNLIREIDAAREFLKGLGQCS